MSLLLRGNHLSSLSDEGWSMIVTGLREVSGRLYLLRLSMPVFVWSAGEDLKSRVPQKLNLRWKCVWVVAIVVCHPAGFFQFIARDGCF